MVSLEQIKLLEAKVSSTIDYVQKVNAENKRLKDTLDSYQVRIEELEVIVLKFKEDQGMIENGILSTLDRLNQFEGAAESLTPGDSEVPEQTETQRYRPRHFAD